jgi:hypothetical protein
MARTIILVLTLALTAYVAYSTVALAIEDGFTVFVALALLIIALFGVGVTGALISGSRDD